MSEVTKTTTKPRRHNSIPYDDISSAMILKHQIRGFDRMVFRDGREPYGDNMLLDRDMESLFFRELLSLRLLNGELGECAHDVFAYFPVGAAHSSGAQKLNYTLAKQMPKQDGQASQRR